MLSPLTRDVPWRPVAACAVLGADRRAAAADDAATVTTIAIRPSSYVGQGAGDHDDGRRPCPAPTPRAGRRPSRCTSWQSDNDVAVQHRQEVRDHPRRAAQLQRVGRDVQRLPGQAAARCASRPAPSSSTRNARRRRRPGDRHDRHRRASTPDPAGGDRCPDVRGGGRRRPARHHPQVRHHARAAQRGQHRHAELAEPLHRPRDQAPPPADCANAATTTTTAAG